jgi:hypothetical protein
MSTALLKRYVDNQVQIARDRLLKQAEALQQAADIAVKDIKRLGRTGQVGGSNLPYLVAEMFATQKHLDEMTDVQKAMEDCG